MTAVDFRCEQCGKLLSVEALPGSSVKCPHCQKKVVVPTALASLPRPQVPPNAGPPPPPPQAPPVVQEMLQPAGVSNAMTVAMPWVLSLFLHLGLALILSFVTIFVMASSDKKLVGGDVFVNGDEFSENPGGVINPGDPGAQAEARQNIKKNEVTGFAHHDAEVVGDTAAMGKEMALISTAGGGGSTGGGWAKFGLGSGGRGHGPPAAFMGKGGNAHHVIYLIDRSGSMQAGGVFDDVKKQMLTSIGRLHEVQDFHIIFFAEGTPMELPTKRLVPATLDYKAAAVKYLDEVVATGQTDPIQGLKRAFEVMAKADGKRKGKLIFMLTDGDFPNNQAVIDEVRKLNAKHEVHINTYLYGEPDEEFINILKTLAKENGGEAKAIQPHQ